MRRLYLQIYLAFLGVLAVLAVLASAAWFVAHPTEAERRANQGIGAVLSEVLPPASAPRPKLEAALAGLRERTGFDVTVRAPGGALLAAAGDPLPPPPPSRREGGWIPGRGRGPNLSFRLPDDRWLLVRPPRSGHPPRWLVHLALLAVAVGIGAWPLARRLTRRLERLRQRVDRLGAGDLRTRIDVEGHDEVAALAESFNRASERIARLVDAQQSLLAGVSHELRTPLARMRVALELLEQDDRPELRERLARDITSLDEGIDELLLASRLDLKEHLTHATPLDLLALVAEEAARLDAETPGEAVHVSGEPVEIRGDRRLLRRLVRNLLENARRHGGGTPVEASVTHTPGGARLEIADSGPGIPEAERERIFEPFYQRPAPAAPGAGLGLDASAHGATRGVGLGLALVRRIARHHGGDARCLPREAGGTRFQVDLPA